MEKLEESGNSVQVTPQAALRKLKRLLASTDAPKSKIDEAETYFNRLWDYVLKGE